MSYTGLHSDENGLRMLVRLNIGHLKMILITFSELCHIFLQVPPVFHWIGLGITTDLGKQDVVQEKSQEKMRVAH